MIPTRKGTQDLDALVIGRAGMDLYPMPPGTPTHLAREFMSDMGGSSGNIAVAMARAGVRVGLAAPVSDDPAGQFVSERLREYGVEHLTPDPVTGEPRTSLALAELIDQGSRTVIYRNNAADFQLVGEALAPHLTRAPVALATGTALAGEPSRSATLAALVAADFAVLDLDYRPYSWASGADARTTYGAAAGVADLIVGNDEEFAILSGDTDPRAYARRLAQAGKTVIFKEGAAGCTWMQGAQETVHTAFSVKALKPFGAGDAFLGTALARMILGDDPASALRRGSAAAAIVVTRPGCASAMPTSDEIDQFLQEHG